MEDIMNRPLTSKGTIVLIHGLWFTPKSWDQWKIRYERAGYKVVVPAFPHVSDDVEAMRDAASKLNGMSMGKIFDHLAKVIDGIVAETGEQPIIMGHSLGGLAVQVLLDRGYGKAGIAIHGGQSAGFFTLPLSVARATLPIFGKPWNTGGTVLLSPKQFHFAFANTLSLEASNTVRERLQIPAPTWPIWQAALGMMRNRGDASIDYSKADRAPLLFIAGGADNIVPASVNRKNAAQYKTGVVEVKEFPGRSHFTCGQKGWEDVADHALAWAEAKISQKPVLTLAA
jgi:pimeloyl-ACP methyl ester carboxylesterase